MIKSFEKFNSSANSLENFKVLMFHIFDQINKTVSSFRENNIKEEQVKFLLYDDKNLGCFFDHSALNFTFDYMQLDSAILTAKIKTQELENFNNSIKKICKSLNLKINSIIEDPISEGTNKTDNHFTFSINRKDFDQNEKAMSFIESLKVTNKFNL